MDPERLGIDGGHEHLVTGKLPTGFLSGSVSSLLSDLSLRIALPEHTDGGAVERNLVAVTYLSRITAEERSDLSKPEAALANLLG